MLSLDESAYHRRMSESATVGAGAQAVTPVTDDAARQAIEAIGGYAHQLLATVVAWIDLQPGQDLYVEVAEDYATATSTSVDATQVKRTAERITLRSKGVRDAIASYWTLKHANADRSVSLTYLTTAAIGREQGLPFPDDLPGLEYWRVCARRGSDVQPLRDALKKLGGDATLSAFLSSASDQQLRDQLLRPIRWLTQQASTDELKELALEKLLARSRQIADVTIWDCRKLLDRLLVRVLWIATQKANRRLSVVELQEAIEQSVLVQVPRQALAMAGTATHVDGNTTDIDAGDRPLPKPVALRTAIVADLAKQSAQRGFLVIQGGTGLGKSTLARLVARLIGGRWPIVDLRDMKADQANARLREAARLVDRRLAGIILDDLPVELDTSIEARLERVVTAAVAADCIVLVTCSRPPSNRLLSFAAGNCVMPAPAMDIDDVKEIVSQLGGDPEPWGPITHAICRGNPQLVHARLKRLQQLGWPTGEVLGGLDPSTPAHGADDERTAVRRRLQVEMEPPSRTFLYRLSIVGGYFDRRLAMSIGSVTPAIAAPGELLDWLNGPWIEDLGRGFFRLTPLLVAAGTQTLSAADVRAVQTAIVEDLTNRHPMSGALVSTALLHGMLIQHPAGLARLATLPVMHPDERTRAYIAREMMALQYFRTDRPLVAGNAPLSAMLRLAQFHVCVENEAWDTAETCAHRLMSEARDVDALGIGTGLELVALATVLPEFRMPKPVTGWLQLVLRAKHLLETGTGHTGTVARQGADALREAGDDAMHRTFFVVNAMRMPSVSALRSLFGELDALPTDVRNDLLLSFDKGPADRRLLTSNAWFHEHKQGALDGSAAASLYAEMGLLAEAWKQPKLSADCAVAQAVMLAEYADQPDAAMACIDDTEKRLGPHAELVRQRAKLLHQAGRDAEALVAQEKLAGVDPDDHVEQVFSAREAAISASRLGDWTQAIDQYRRLRAAATDNEGDMRIIAVGALGDIAWAQVQLGDVSAAVASLTDALNEIAQIKEDKPGLGHSTRLVVGQAAAQIDQWLSADDDAGRARYVMGLGICSQAEPIAELLAKPLHTLDLSWCQLALLELRHTNCHTVADAVRAWPAERQLTNMAMLLAKDRLEQSLRKQDWREWPALIAHYTAGMLWLRKKAYTPPLVRGAVPPVTADERQSPEASACYVNAALAMMTVLVSASPATNWDQTTQALAKALDGVDEWKELATHLSNNSSDAKKHATLIGQSLQRLGGDRTQLSPDELFVAHWYVADWLSTLDFRRSVSPLVAGLVAGDWERVCNEQSFLLRSPMQTVSEIQRACRAIEKPMDRLAKILSAASHAVRVRLPPGALELLQHSREST